LLLVVRLHFVPGCTVEHVSLKLDHAHFGLCCMHCVQSVNKHNIYCAYFLLHFRLICRPSGRPGNVTLGQYMKPANAASHGSRPPPPPAFRAPPPPPPGPPPSSSSHSAFSSTSKGQLGSAPAHESRQNAWDQPLPGSRLSQVTGAHANALLPRSPVQAQSNVSTSGSNGSAQVRESEGQNGYCEVAVAGTLSHSPALENGNSPVAQLPEAQQQPGGYALEPQHLAQIADLQASRLSLSFCSSFSVCMSISGFSSREVSACRD